MDRLLHYLHEADPRDASGDPPDVRELAGEKDNNFCEKMKKMVYIIFLKKKKKISFRGSKCNGSLNRCRIRKS